MAKVVANANVVITTALVPGKKAPILITEAMVDGMEPGSLIVDMAAEKGGNCELTKPGQTTNYKGVTLLGPTNLPATVPYHASQMYAKNITTFLLHLVKEGQPEFDLNDQITNETLVSIDGAVVHARISELLNQPPSGTERISN